MNKGLFIITGANGGMGKAITRAIAGMGVPVIMACRNVERAAGVRDEIVRETGNGRVELHQLDLASVASIRSFVDGLNGREVSVLVNNAGIMCRKIRHTIPPPFTSTLTSRPFNPSTKERMEATDAKSN